MQPKLLSREAFRESVFQRDGGKCVFCDKPAVDAHHILERRLWPDGGYYLDNGASVCAEHHIACEQTTISAAMVREAAGITKACIPPHLYDEQPYDKWGNPITESGQRLRGELWHDKSVQKVLAAGGVLAQFIPYVKHPRTHHLPWSPGVHDDDRVLTDAQVCAWAGQELVITKKMDGEQTSMYTDYIHARSLDSRGGEDRAWVKQFWSTIAHDIPPGWRVCGENVWAEHSIHYAALPSYFLGFNMWNEFNVCLDWDTTREWFELLGITPVPTLWRTQMPRDHGGVVREIRAVERDLNFTRDEGYVVRLAGSFDYAAFRKCVGKFVRPGHVQTTKHWRAGRRFVPNELEQTK